MEMTLENMAIISFLWRNDCHFLHHNVRGLSFGEVHEKFGEYYDKALDDADYFAEHAIMKEIDAMINFSDIYEMPVFKQWTPITAKQIGSEAEIDEAFDVFINNGNDYLDALDMCREYCEDEGWNDIVSDIDSIRAFWAVEIEYKATKY